MTDAHEIPDLRARLAEAESLVKLLRHRSIADQRTMHRAVDEIDSLRQRLADREDAYEQLARLVETTDGQTATRTDQEQPCPPPTS